MDTRRAAARALPRAACNGIAAPSPDLTLIACGKGGKTTVSDIVSGRARFTIQGIGPLWSSRGWLTSATPDGASGQTGSAVVADAAGVTRAVIPGTPVAWSPDGRSLAFQHDQALWIAGPGELRDAHSLLGAWAGGLVSFTADSRFISATGGQGAQLISLADGHRVRDIDGGSGVWSRSGRLAYVDFAAVAAAGTPAGAKVAVMVTDTHGRNPHRVGAFPYDDHGYADLRWLPDGRRVLLVTSSECGGGGLYTVPASGGPTRALTHDPRDLEAPAWSPDGTRIAFTVQKFSCHLGAGGPIHLATIAADGSDPRRVTDDDDFDSSPSFSPDGARIAFVHASFTDASLQTVPAAGGERTQLIPPAGGSPMNAAWSPDGSRIAYAMGRSIKAVPAAGGTPDVIAADLPAIACGNGGIAWSPDGKQLAFGAGAGIYLMTAGDPASAHLAIAVKCADDPAFSPDGTQIAFDASPAHPLGQQTAIMVANADGSGVRTLSTAPFRRSGRPAWQPA